MSNFEKLETKGSLELLFYLYKTKKEGKEIIKTTIVKKEKIMSMGTLNTKIAEYKGLGLIDEIQGPEHNMKIITITELGEKFVETMNLDKISKFIEEGGDSKVIL